MVLRKEGRYLRDEIESHSAEWVSDLQHATVFNVFPHYIPEAHMAGVERLEVTETRTIALKPRTIRIGEFDVPEPLRVAPKRVTGKVTKYWTVSLSSIGAVDAVIWDNDCWDKLFLARGIIHLTREAAEIHTKALLSFTEVKP